MNIDQFIDTKGKAVAGRNKVMRYVGSSQPLFALVKGKQKKVGSLENGDLIYAINKADVMDFLVIKFEGTPYHYWSFKGDEKYFKAYFDKEDKNYLNVDAEGNLPSKKKFKSNIAIPVIAGAGGVVVGYHFGERIGKDKIICAILCGALFTWVGYLVTQIGGKKKDELTDAGATITNTETNADSVTA